MKVYNTMSRSKEEFVPMDGKTVRMYSCGPTVYNFAHIGNLRTYLFMDILRRVLKYDGYKLKGVMNITDVGHLLSDADEGEDKMVKASREQKKSPYEIAAYYTSVFFADLEKLNIKRPDVVEPATNCIDDFINMISVLLIAMVIRLFPIFMLGYYIIESTKTDEFVAAMENWHVPQAFIIPISVVFRFIPTLGEESAAITDAMRMRGIQFGTKKFWQAPTAILEYRVVPLMLSVVKIGDELSAAALTRGLGGLKHRTTISNIGFTFCDAIIALLSVGLLIWALLWGGVLS